MVNQMDIKFLTASTFFAGVSAMVEHGLTFHADYESLTIVLTGGY